MDQHEKDEPEGKPSAQTSNKRARAVQGDVAGGKKRVVKPAGGVQVGGNVGGDVVGGDKNETQNISGDYVGRDKITTTTVTQGLTGDQAAKLLAAFAEIQHLIDARPADPNVEKGEIKRVVDEVKTEVQKGEAANPNKVERWLANLGAMAPDILKVTVATLANPAAGVATAIQLIAKKAQA
jgi:hypothetical protein